MATRVPLAVCYSVLMVFWSSYRTYGNSQKWERKVCGVLIAATLGPLCVMLQGATHHNAQGAVAAGHVTVENPLLLLERPMLETMKMESVVSWNSFCLHFLGTNEQ